jgi:midasin (ATPase involved in ribosome maturation)
VVGQKLVEVALTSSTDTSDLLGGFEQLEPRRQLQVNVLLSALHGIDLPG